MHDGLPLEALALTNAHRKVEGGHREAWQAYRDGVAAACGIAR